MEGYIFYCRNFSDARLLREFSQTTNSAGCGELVSLITALLALALKSQGAGVVLFSGKLPNAASSGFKKASVLRPAALIAHLSVRNQPVVFAELAACSALHAEKTCVEKGIYTECLLLKQRYGAEIFFPLRAKSKLIGLLLLGEKQTGIAYARQDFTLMNIVSARVARLIAGTRKNRLIEVFPRENMLPTQENLHQAICDASHNLQTPLTIIKAGLGTLKREGIQSKNIVLIEQSVDALSQSIYDLLALAELENGCEMKAAKLDFSTLLVRVAEYFSAAAEKQNITISRAIYPNVLIRADESKIESAVANLISNAIKYIANEQHILISLAQRGQKAVLRIIDTGIGIDPDDAPHLFDRFYRSKKIASRIRGSGLGLSIAREIFNMHHGTISIQSRPRVGTMVTVILPLYGRG